MDGQLAALYEGGVARLQARGRSVRLELQKVREGMGREGGRGGGLMLCMGFLFCFGRIVCIVYSKLCMYLCVCFVFFGGCGRILCFVCVFVCG